MQNQGRGGGSRQGGPAAGRGGFGYGFNMGMAMGMGYGGAGAGGGGGFDGKYIWGAGYMPPFPPPPLGPVYGRGMRPVLPLGAQGSGILKPPVGPPQGPLLHGRGHARGYGGRAWGGRGRSNLTKEALDADLDEWRMKDKKLGGQSLDADLDEYWKRKDGQSQSSRSGSIKRLKTAAAESASNQELQATEQSNISSSDGVEPKDNTTEKDTTENKSD
ncbi:hypothetical protein O6H91_14G052000 [Diphasiastrum complanatum]|uniref:Uncharacterized protein n=1 Tax=Diphasiastrum complanatum TaxID=34168 RepID=A0ACC2BPE8_DIPCM|nr:hypothetical protein O6H91_14G052000 [Diphasiastrum complanatum]